MNNQVLYVCFKSLFLLFLPSLKASGTGNIPLFFSWIRSRIRILHMDRDQGGLPYCGSGTLLTRCVWFARSWCGLGAEALGPASAGLCPLAGGRAVGKAPPRLKYNERFILRNY